MTGKTLSHYRILEELGSGGMGVVHRAFDTTLNRPVALKFLTDRGCDEGIDRFLREARAASALNHPNIVTIHEIGEAETGRYFVMEWIDGVTLRDWTRQPRPLDAVLSIAQQVARALGAAHAAGIVHRDIKPENIMVRPDGYVKVLDFGLAQQMAGEAAETLAATLPGTILGTLRYMSPEQSRGESAYAASDISLSAWCCMRWSPAGTRSTRIRPSACSTASNPVSRRPRRANLHSTTWFSR